MELNSALIVGADLDAEKLVGWKGASFSARLVYAAGDQR